MSKRRIINAFFKSQLNYCPLIWMSYRCTNHCKINRLHEWRLRTIYFDKTSFEALLEKDCSVSIHNKNLQLLVNEMYKASEGLSPPIITQLFEKKNYHQYNLRQNSKFTILTVNSVYCGTENISFLGPKIRDILPDRLKRSTV